MARSLTSALLVVALIAATIGASGCTSPYGGAQTVRAQESSRPPKEPATPEQIRRFVRLTKLDQDYRARWLAALESNRSKGEPYWPESLWTDVRHEMETTDLVPVIAGVYRQYVSSDMMRDVDMYLENHTVADFAATPLGSHFCALQHEADQVGSQATLELTQSVLERVYQRHKPEIKAARAKYLREHPDWKD